MTIRLLPHHQKDVHEGLRRQTQMLLGNFLPALNGVPTRITAIRMHHDHGMIHEDMAAIHVKVTVDFEVFQPSVGMLLRGVVNKISESHVGVQINDQFNASVAKADLPRDYQFNAAENTYDHAATPERQLTIGSKVIVLVADLMRSSHGAINIKGQMNQPGTGPDFREEEEEDEVPAVETVRTPVQSQSATPQVEGSKKKHKSKKSKEDAAPTPSSSKKRGHKDVASDTPTKAKKSKKDKSKAQ
ncbi:uncharacterized protein MONBRDRAFT_7890 [Monosiga brevicollis MX1]|uniref:S1 motif domain-containing protein n=1 Tax=Monosiga brevicollis TaxID=81824 RepID=A9UYD7_MONBE|nr:uncharacterized protein MONBRDRAFT_7890 [Monosiga brevicollis MX1]EDQ89587.1 predicted protein [Monosiga brevicollis MX1]|eukprot:XP_001745616.1 hypothetical protein [Monosiga brevicollis MX1]